MMSRMTNDMNEIEASVMRSLEVLIKDPLTVIVYLIVLIGMSPKLTIFVFLVLPVVGLIIGLVGKSLRIV